MEELFARLEKSLLGLAALENDGDMVEMTHDEFLQWVLGQVDAAKGDGVEVRKARLMHVSNQLASVRKNFIGPTPTATGKISVGMFKDPAQAPTTIKTVEPTGALPNATGASTNPIPPGVAGGAGKVQSGGQMPPVVAGSSGFVSPSQATFAKAIDAISEKLDGLTGEASGEASASEASGEASASEASGESVAKSVRMIWPLDMATDFGMGKIDDPGVPEWGFDADLNATEGQAAE